MKSITLFILIAFAGLSAAKSQVPIGIPQVTSYRGLDYGAGDQNWGIAQDKNGVLFSQITKVYLRLTACIGNYILFQIRLL